VHPPNPIPPHCWNFFAEQAGVVGTGALLVTIVVGTAVGAAVGAAEVGSAGLELPVPSQTGPPGTMYVVAVLAAALSMLKSMPGSEAEYAPGKERRADAGGETVPLPVTFHCEHSG
jgi:hypothetical protein